MWLEFLSNFITNGPAFAFRWLSDERAAKKRRLAKGR